jgi:hypothetical protein
MTGRHTSRPARDGAGKEQGLSESTIFGMHRCSGIEFKDFEMISESSPSLADATSLDVALAEVA